MKRHALALLAACALTTACGAAHAATIAFGNPGGDSLGQSSFAAGTHWSDGLAPTSGNDYVVGISLLRTPADGNSYTFAGDSLSIDGPSGDFGYKGTGATGVITVDNLVLNGGLIRHINGAADVFELAGNVNVVANSQLYAKQGAINLTAVLAGSANITNPGSDGAGRTLRIMSPLNTYAGSIVNNGRLELVDDALLNFVIGASGVNNSLSGNGPENVINGDFAFNLSGAGSTVGDSWTIVSAANRSFGTTFNVVGFSSLGGGLWQNGAYQFDESTGVLSVVPEPTTAALGLITLAFVGRCRRFGKGSY